MAGPQHKGARRSSARDAEIGCILRQHRLIKGLSQTDLGDLIGVTFQQIQKYENGRNRISSGRLQHIAEVLNIPIATFFSAHTPAKRAQHDDRPSPVDLVKTEGAIRLLQAFGRVSDIEARRALITIAEVLAH